MMKTSCRNTAPNLKVKLLAWQSPTAVKFDAILNDLNVLYTAVETVTDIYVSIKLYLAYLERFRITD